jgi:ribonuclease-3
MPVKILRKISSLLSRDNVINPDFKIVESIIKYKFTDQSLLLKAFTHSSYLSISGGASYDSNERLEFLGDAVLDLVVTEFLYISRPKTREGTLSKMKSVLVSRKVLANVIAKMDLGRFLLVNFGEEKTGGKKRPSNLANLYETILGAIYLDGGLEKARAFIMSTLLNDYQLVLKNESFVNYKSILLELAQGKGDQGPIYELVSESGPDHEKKFVMDVHLGDSINARGIGKSKKVAEQRAAKNLLKIVAPDKLDNGDL